MTLISKGFQSSRFVRCRRAGSGHLIFIVLQGWMIQIPQLTVEQVKEKIDKKENFSLIDVREENEYETCRIENSILIPLSEFAKRALNELKADDEIVIHCHHGGRSQKACEYLAGQGFKKVANMAGGIDQWSLEIDSKVPRY